MKYLAMIAYWTLAWVALATPAAAQHVAILVPAAAGTSTYWELLLEAYRAVSRSLGMRLDIYYASPNDRFKTLTLAEEILKKKDHPSYLIMGIELQIAERIIKVAQEQQVRVMFTTDFSPEEVAYLGGGPRRTYAAWFSQVPSPGFEAGEALARTLVQAAHKRKLVGHSGRTHMLAINGGKSWLAAEQREAGLQAELGRHPDIDLQQVVYAKWKRDEAGFMILQLLKRYPDTQLVWVASDGMAAGVIEAIKSTGRKLCVDIMVGSIDASAEGIELVHKGELLTTVGEYWSTQAMRLVFIYDDAHHHASAATASVDFPDAVVTAANSDLYRQPILAKAWNAMDWRRLTLTHGPSTNRYVLDAMAILNRR